MNQEYPQIQNRRISLDQEAGGRVASPLDNMGAIRDFGLITEIVVLFLIVCFNSGAGLHRFTW